MLAPLRDAASDEKLEKVIVRCEKRRDWVVTSRDLVSARTANDAKEADKLLATWEAEGRAVREASEGRQTKPRYRILKSRG